MFQNESGEVEKYDVNIKKVNYTNKNDGKDMVIEVTDERLINYTGGIVQGMSGAPIIQNNKIIGALTHVFLDNSKIGYGIFIDKMII
ncbi:spoIVB peptidase S55 family protein [[Clostridium] sordellii ATCC 9714]|nr:spoIVB peptidase S55 family protein [[Clostridium] sordellii ATCC 9714] [Paeniclostridium sordellii ATCC 9714]